MKKEGGAYFGSPLGARKIASGASLGALLGRSWALLGPLRREPTDERHHL